MNEEHSVLQRQRCQGKTKRDLKWLAYIHLITKKRGGAERP